MAHTRSDCPRPTRLRVECYAGYRGEETPRRFFLHDRCFEVARVLDCWIGPQHRYFKLLARDDDVYILRQDTVHDRWELTMFAASGYLEGGAGAPESAERSDC